MIDLICPKCGERAGWQQYSADGIGTAYCLTQVSYGRPRPAKEPCDWTGLVIRNPDQTVRIATDDDVAEIKKQPSVF